MITGKDSAEAYMTARGLSVGAGEGFDINTAQGMAGPFHFEFVRGAYFTEAIFSPVQNELVDRGHTTSAPSLESSNPNTRRPDDINRVKDDIGDSKNVMLVTFSRGVETYGVLDALHQEGKLGQIAGWIILNSGGPHEFTPRPAYPGESESSRYTQLFDELRPEEVDGLSEFDREAAKRVFCNEVRDSGLLKLALDSIRPQRASDTSPSSLAVPAGIPIHILQGKRDRALNLERADRVFGEWLGKKTIKEDGAHMLALENPARLAEKLVKLSLVSTLQQSFKSDSK